MRALANNEISINSTILRCEHPVASSLASQNKSQQAHNASHSVVAPSLQSHRQCGADDDRDPCRDDERLGRRAGVAKAARGLCFFVEDAASLIDGSGWATALEGAAEVVVECDCCVEDVASTLTEAFWPERRVLRHKSGAGLRRQLARARRLPRRRERRRPRPRPRDGRGRRPRDAAVPAAPHRRRRAERLGGAGGLRRRSSRPARGSTWTTCCPRGRSKPPGRRRDNRRRRRAACERRRLAGPICPAAAHRSPAPTEGRRALLAPHRLWTATLSYVLNKQYVSSAPRAPGSRLLVVVVGGAYPGHTSIRAYRSYRRGGPTHGVSSAGDGDRDPSSMRTRPKVGGASSICRRRAPRRYRTAAAAFPAGRPSSRRTAAGKRGCRRA